MARDHNKYNPVFLLSPARSHSSVVVSMIGGHPQLYGFPELILFDQETIGERIVAPPSIGKQPPGWNPVAGVEAAIAELQYGGQTENNFKEARRWLEERKTWTGIQVMDHLLELIYPLRGVEKSPETSYKMENMMRIADAYPKAQFIHLVRHPVTTQRSVQRYYFMYKYPTHCAKGWINQHKRILQFCQSNVRDRSIIMRSEDILNEPYIYLRRIADWLGISSDNESIEAMLDTNSSPYVRFGVQQSRIWYDPFFLERPTPHRVELPSSLDKPDEWDIAEDVWSEVVELAERLGYGSVSANCC